MSNTWFTSDPHYYHKNIIKHCAKTRGHFNSVEEMNESLIEKHNAVVRPDDLVFNLGDFAFASKLKIVEILKQLNGDIFLLKGNHDRVFSDKFVTELILEGLLIGVGSVYKQVKLDGVQVILNHFAQRTWDRAFHGSIHLYGHSHGTLPGIGKSVDVGVDSIDMWAFTGDSLRPWSWAEILAYMDNKPCEQDGTSK